MILRRFSFGAAAVLCAVVAVAWVGAAQGAVVAISLTKCGTANGGFQFTLNGSGFTPGTPLEVDITSSEAGAFAIANYVFPGGVTAPFINPVAVLNADGTFSFAFNAGSGQLLPATITVASFDPVAEVPIAQLFTTTVTNASVCTDGSTLANAPGGGGTGGGGGNGGGSGLPTSADQCKKMKWVAYGVFKNQGDCVSFVATRGKNPPARRP